MKTALVMRMFVQAGDLTNQVEALLMAVKATNDFEAEMAQKFGGAQAQPEENENVRVLVLRTCQSARASEISPFLWKQVPVMVPEL